MKTALLSLFIALGVACFSAYQFEKCQTFKAETQTALMQIDSDIKPALSQVNADLREIKQESEWKVAGAEQLIRLALEQLQTSRDLNTSIRLLAAADDQLQSLQDPRFIPIRESLKQDQLALKALKLPDREGLWLTITALINKIPEFPTRGVRHTVLQEKSEVKADPSANPQDKAQTWKTELQHSLQGLKDLVKIQRHSKPIEPILSENQQILAKENLRLLLEQMRWSVLHDNPTVYQTSIQETIGWLNAYFEPNDEHVKQLLITLTELSAVHLHPDLPELGQALQLLQNTR